MDRYIVDYDEVDKTWDVCLKGTRYLFVAAFNDVTVARAVCDCMNHLLGEMRKVEGYGN